VGTSEGANTYDDIYFARVALTILWQRDGGKAINYKIERFTSANIIAASSRLRSPLKMRSKIMRRTPPYENHPHSIPHTYVARAGR
jgi:hypothetical protein